VSQEFLLTIVTGLGGLLSGAVAKMWVAFTAELKDCKEDRKEFRHKIDSLQTDMITVSSKLGRLEGKLEDEIDNNK
jgi:hypothetical protein